VVSVAGKEYETFGLQTCRSNALEMYDQFTIGMLILRLLECQEK
jgi:hypothetical protein